jgi:hypothetical protein
MNMKVIPHIIAVPTHQRDCSMLSARHNRAVGAVLGEINDLDFATFTFFQI